MHHRPKTVLGMLAALLALCIATLAVHAEEDQPPGGDRAPIQLRILCFQPVAGAEALTLRQGDDGTPHDIDLVPSMVSDPIGIGRGELILTRREAAVAGASPLLRIPLPDGGTRFALVLWPAAASETDRVYRHILIRTDDLRFNTSDLHLMNLTKVPVGGTLGTRRFTLNPGGSKIIRPDPPAGDRMYQARFFHEIDGQARLFSDTRWPLAASARVYLFFIPDAQGQSITYLSFREYAPFP